METDLFTPPLYYELWWMIGKTMRRRGAKRLVYQSNTIFKIETAANTIAFLNWLHFELMLFKVPVRGEASHSQPSLPLLLGHKFLICLYNVKCLQNCALRRQPTRSFLILFLSGPIRSRSVCLRFCSLFRLIGFGAI